MGTRGKGRVIAVEPSTATRAAGFDGRRVAVPRGRAERRKTAKRAAKKRRRSLVRELPLVVIVALVIALVLKTFFVQVFVIPSGSMEQTIQIGDRVLVDKLTPWFGSQPSRGEVVVFRDPGGWLENDRTASTDGPVLRQVKQVFSSVGLLPSDNEHDLIKRVIGVGGDTVECCDAKGRVSVNGTPIDESGYLAPGNVPSRQPFKITVPAGRLWVMGDHRDLSADSRFHMANPGGGTIPVGNVVGRAFVIAWPLPRLGRLEVPEVLSSLPRRSATATGTAAASPAASAQGADSALAASARASGGIAGGRPDPAEPSLVMGVLGVLPLVSRWGSAGRRRRCRAG